MRLVRGSKRSQPISLGLAFDPRRNSLNAIRLLLAVLVIVSHSWPLGGYGDDPGPSQNENLGAWAVAGFFVISGYLICSSALNARSPAEYLWRRFLRIYPAFLVALVVVAFVLAPLSMFVDARAAWSPTSAILFVVRNAGLTVIQPGIDGTLTTTPFAGAWNGSLWTIAYEVLCYLWLGLLVTLVRSERTLLRALILLFTAGTAVLLMHAVLGSTQEPAIIRFVRLSTLFCAGAIVYLCRNSLRCWWPLALISATVVVVSAGYGVFEAVAPLPLAYLMIYLGQRLPLHAVGANNDVSYGMYIYAFPVQQLLALVLGPATVPAAVFALVAVLLTLPLAWASWLLIERPALRLKNLIRRGQPSRDERAQI